MPTAILRPDSAAETSDATHNDGWNFTNCPGGTVAGADDAMRDDNPNTNISALLSEGGSVLHSKFLTFEFNTFTIPSGAVVTSVQPRLDAAYFFRSIRVFYALRADAVFAAEQSVTVAQNSADPPYIASYSGLVYNNAPDGGAWDQAAINTLGLRIWAEDPGGNTLGVVVAEMYLDVTYNQTATATVTGPPDNQGVVQPVVSWTVNDPEGDAQTGYEVHVFSAAQYGIGGFDPSTSPNTWDSGQVSSANTSVQVGVALTPGTTYRAYVRLRDAGTSAWGAWSYREFTIATNAAPSCTVTAPTGTITNTSQPMVVWTYSDPTGDPQERYHVKVFTQAEYTEPTFNPTLDTPGEEGWDSGVVYDDVLTVQVGDVLPNSTTYRAYVRVGDVTQTGHTPNWSAWAYNTFTLNLTPPGVPTLGTPVVDGDADSVEILVTAGNLPGGVTSQTIEVQRSIDDGDTWVTVLGWLAKSFGGPGDAQTMVDYWVQRGQPVIYRAQSTAIVSNQPVASAWVSGGDPVTITGADPCAWLKSSSDGAYNLAVDVVNHPWLSSSSDERQAVYEPAGRSTPIVHSIGISGEVFDGLRLFFKTDAEWTAFESLRALREPVLVQLPYGDSGGVLEQHWVRFGKRTVERSAVGPTQYRAVTVDAREVAEPTAL